MPEFRRILVTGAAGSLGSHLRTGLAPLADRLRLTDIRDLGAAAPHEELVQCDLADRAAALELTRDCDAIVHFAGHPRELTFDEVMRGRPPRRLPHVRGRPAATAPAASSTRARSTPSASIRSRRSPTPAPRTAPTPSTA